MGNGQSAQSKREADKRYMEEMGADTEVGSAEFYFGGTSMCQCYGCDCADDTPHRWASPPWGFGGINNWTPSLANYEGVHKEVMPVLQQLDPEVNQIVVEGAEKDCGWCYLCDRTFKLSSVKKALTDKGWLAKVNAHLGQHGRVADLHIFSRSHGQSSLEFLQLRVFKLRESARQQAMDPPAEVPRPLFMS